MAEAAFLIGVARSVGSTLASYTQEQLLLSRDLDSEVQKLKRTMDTINAILRDVEERGGGTTISHSDQVWLANLCSAVYDADDVFDEIMTMAERKRLMEGNAFRKEVKLFFSSSNQLITSISLAQRVKSIRENLDGISKDRRDFASGSGHREDGEQVESRNLSDNVVGRENEKDEIMSMLLDSNIEDNVCVIPIVGIGGLGKSTLARYVFNDEKVKANFKDLHLWVPLTQGFSLKGVIEKIVAISSQEQSVYDLESNKRTTPTQGEPRRSELGKNQRSCDLEQLKVSLSSLINGKKYILVLDNFWNESIADWRDLKSLLTLGAAQGSRVLLTTRSPSIGKTMGTVKSFELQPLESQNSWSLFESIVFGERGCYDPNLKEIGLKILPICYNVPLAIRALASLLATKISVSFWSMFQSDTISNLAKHDKCYDIMPILKLSYDYLRPSTLKSCFSYCSLFPKGYEFDKNKLVILWIAQGFVAPLHEGHLSLEDEGAEYLDMLVNKGLLQEVPNDESHIHTCKLHDLMYDLCCNVSAGQCQYLSSREDLDVERSVRHVSINYKADISFKIPRSLRRVKQLRTFCLTDSRRSQAACLSTSPFYSLIQSFLCLRVLDLHDCGIKEVPESLGKLFHLRYLDLSSNAFKRLPNSVTLLHNLQYLNLEHCWNLNELPSNMNKLVNLSHLIVDMLEGNLCHFPSGLGNLTNLQTLTSFYVGAKKIKRACTNKSKYGCLSDLKSLDRLRGELAIVIKGFYKNMGSDAREANLKGKKNIKCLTLKWDMDQACNDEDELVLENLQPHNQISILSIETYKGNKMPTWMGTNRITSCLQNLTAIAIWGCENIKHLPSFSQLPYLETLCLYGLPVVEYMETSPDECEGTSSLALSSSSTVFFPSLTKIIIRKLPNLKGWKEHEEANLSFPCASIVFVHSCEKLESLPSCPNVETLLLQSVRNLRMLIGGGVSSSSSSSFSSSSSLVPKLDMLVVDSAEFLASLPRECLQKVSKLCLKQYGAYSSNHSAPGNIIGKGLEGMTSLKSLELEGNFLAGFSGLPLQLSATLERLELCMYEDNLFLGSGDESENAWRALKSLRFLKVDWSYPSEVLPRGIRHLTTLQSLEVSCYELEAIPDWIGNLCSLSRLEIKYCAKLTSLPQEMTKLTQLELLVVSDCPQLQPRLVENVGEDWHKIQHIKEIILEGSSSVN